MNQAFVKANDGWNTCLAYMETCLYADEHGKCVFDECRQHKEKKSTTKAQPQKGC